MGSTFIHEHDRFTLARPLNALTVDVEDYFQVSAFDRMISRHRWDHLPSRVQCNLERIIELFEIYRVKATFFTLGWIGERFPRLVGQIAAAGHEIASHGYEHIRVTEQTPGQFRNDITRTKMLLEDVTGQRVSGYRAASFSVGAKNLWALDTLEQVGYRYSSSVYPIRHDLYGMREAPRFPFRLREDGLLEIPITTVSVMNHNLPCGGGGYFRLLPYRFSRWALHRINQCDRQPCVFYFHPWEIDPYQPRMNGVGLRNRFRHYVNLSRMESKIERLLTDFSWDRMDKVFGISWGR